MVGAQEDVRTDVEGTRESRGEREGMGGAGGGGQGERGARDRERT